MVSKTLRLTSLHGPEDYTVGDCLVWNRRKSGDRFESESQRFQSAASSAGTYRGSKAGGLRDTAGEAIRGWPQYGTMDLDEDNRYAEDGYHSPSLHKQTQTDNEDDNQQNDKNKVKKKKKIQKETPIPKSASSFEITDRKTSPKRKKTNVKRSPSVKNRLKKAIQDEEANMYDIMSQRYRADYLKQREAEEEAQRKRQTSRQRTTRDGKRSGRETYRTTKTSELRAQTQNDRSTYGSSRQSRSQNSAFRNTTFGGGGGGLDGRLWGCARGSAGSMGYMDKRWINNGVNQSQAVTGEMEEGGGGDEVGEVVEEPPVEPPSVVEEPPPPVEEPPPPPPPVVTATEEVVSRLAAL